MPSLGADMEAGRLVAWHVKPGDEVKRGDIVAEVETDKGVIEVEVFQTGTVQRLLVAVGARVPVGTPLALVREAATPTTPGAGAVGAPTRQERQAPGAEPPPVTAEPPPVTAEPLPPANTETSSGERLASLHSAAHSQRLPRLRISPSARRLARELGVELAGLSGSGPGGAITRQDVLRQSAKATAAPERSAAERMRQAIAAAMSRSNREIPHYWVQDVVDLSATIDWLQRGEPAPSTGGASAVRCCAAQVRRAGMPAVSRNERPVRRGSRNATGSCQCRDGGQPSRGRLGGSRSAQH